MGRTWRDEFLMVLAYLENHAERRDSALVALRTALLAEPSTSEFMPLKAAAFHSRFSPERIRLWAYRGFVVAKRDGGRWLIEIGSLRRYLQLRADRLLKSPTV